MKTLHFLLTVLRSLPACLPTDKQIRTFLLYLPGIDRTPINAGSRHQSCALRPRARHVEIDADILNHETFIA